MQDFVHQQYQAWFKGSGCREARGLLKRLTKDILYDSIPGVSGF